MKSRQDWDALSRLGSAIAREALQIIVDENMAERAVENGAYLMDYLAEINSSYDDHYRSRGLLVGIVLKREAGGALCFCETFKKRGEYSPKKPMKLSYA